MTQPIQKEESDNLMSKEEERRFNEMFCDADGDFLPYLHPSGVKNHIINTRQQLKEEIVKDLKSLKTEHNELGALECARGHCRFVLTETIEIIKDK